MSSLLSSRPSLFSLRVLATGKSRRQGDGSDRAHRRRLPIAAVPHDTGVSGVVEVSNNTDRRVSVRNVERATSDPSRFPYSLSEPQPARKTERFCPMEQYKLAKCAAPFLVRLLVHLAEKKGRVQALSRGGRDAPARCDRQSGQLHGHAARRMRGDGIEVTVRFSETVKVEWRPSSAAIATTGSRSTTSCAASRAWPWQQPPSRNRQETRPSSGLGVGVASESRRPKTV